jgi:hypothetical protein
VIIFVNACVFDGSLRSTNRVIKKKANTIQQATVTDVLMALVTSERISGVPVKFRLASRNPKYTMEIIERNTIEKRIVSILSSLYRAFEEFENPASTVAPTIDVTNTPTVIAFVIN